MLTPEDEAFLAKHRKLAEPVKPESRIDRLLVRNKARQLVLLARQRRLLDEAEAQLKEL